MPTLTVEQARNGGLRSVQARRANKAELLRLRQRVAELESAFPLKQDIEPKQTIPELATRTREHIDAIDKLIEDCTDAKEMDALTRSREREWRIYAHCSGIPGPGNLKPVAKSKPRQEYLPEPTPAVPTPTVTPSAPAQPGASQGPQQGQ